jgi:hypothetical protein
MTPPRIVNTSDIELTNRAKDCKNLVDSLLDFRSGRHCFNPGFFNQCRCRAGPQVMRTTQTGL